MVVSLISCQARCDSDLALLVHIGSQVQIKQVRRTIYQRRRKASLQSTQASGSNGCVSPHPSYISALETSNGNPEVTNTSLEKLCLPHFLNVSSHVQSGKIRPCAWTPQSRPLKLQEESKKLKYWTIEGGIAAFFNATRALCGAPAVGKSSFVSFCLLSGCQHFGGRECSQSAEEKEALMKQRAAAETNRAGSQKGTDSFSEPCTAQRIKRFYFCHSYWNLAIEAVNFCWSGGDIPCFSGNTGIRLNVQFS